jgi:hypothetical protein
MLVFNVIFQFFFLSVASKLAFVFELQIPIVNYIFRESLKRKASDAETVSLNLLTLFLSF